MNFVVDMVSDLQKKTTKKIGAYVCGKCTFVWRHNYPIITLICIDIFENLFIAGYNMIVTIPSLFLKKEYSLCVNTNMYFQFCYSLLTMHYFS